MESTIIAILAVLVGLGSGAIGGFFGQRLLTGKRRDAAEQEASQILTIASEERRSVLREAKEEALRVQSERDAEYREHRERRTELQRIEQRLANREENVERRSTNLERKERSLLYVGMTRARDWCGIGEARA